MSSEIYTQLNTLSIELKTSLQALLQTLENEHQHLLEKDTGALIKIAAQKKQLSEKIEQLEQFSTSLIAETGTKLEQKAVTQFIALATETVPSLTENYQQITKLGKQCADQNQVNGMILESNRRNIESRLAILRGQPLTPDSYARNGRTTSASHSKTLAQV